RRERLSASPGFIAGPFHTEVQNRIVEYHPHLGEFILDVINERGEHAVDLVEVVVEVSKIPVPHRFGGSNSKVEIDVGIDTEQQMLEDDGPVVRRALKSESPGLSREAAGAVGEEGVKVSISRSPLSMG